MCRDGNRHEKRKIKERNKQKNMGNTIHRSSVQHVHIYIHDHYCTRVVRDDYFYYYCYYYYLYD